MRRTVRYLCLFFGVIMMLALFGCGKQKHKLHMEPRNSTVSAAEEHIRVTFINNVETADVWVLPQTEENLKSSLWGTANAKNLDANTQRDITISKTHEQDLYIVNIIDADHAYFSAKDIRLDDGYSIRFLTDGSKYDALIEILDGDGNVLNKQNAFAGMLGTH